MNTATSTATARHTMIGRRTLAGADGTCIECGNAYRAGDDIRLIQSVGAWAHEDCDA